MWHHLRLYPALLQQQLKIMLEYRMDFVIGAGSSILVNAAYLGTLSLVMARVPTLNGWSLPELLLIYGLMLMARALMDTFAGNFWSIGSYVRRGRFDLYLVRPINPLFHFLTSSFDTTGVGTLLIGGAVVLTAGRALHLFTLVNVLYLALTVLCGSLIFFSINLITASTAFWVVDAMPFVAVAFEANNFAHYPLTIFPKAIGVLVTWIVPYGFAAYYPAAYLLGRPVGWLPWLAPVMAVILLIGGYRVWLLGLRHYESTGS
jgi:ABC-2 type transport system permease protein